MSNLEQRTIVIPTSDERENPAVLVEGIVTLGPDSPIMVNGHTTHHWRRAIAYVNDSLILWPAPEMR